MSGFIKTTSNNVITPLLFSANEWTNAQTFDTNITCGGLVTANNGLTVNGAVTIPAASIPITAVNGLSSTLATLDPTTTVNAAIASAIAPYSTTTQMNSAIATAIAPLDPTTTVNAAIASAIAPYSTTTQMNTALTTYAPLGGAAFTGNISTSGTTTSTGLITASNGIQVNGTLGITGATTSNSLYYENTQVIGGGVNAYTFSYSGGGLFYIPSSIAILANATLIVTNIPTTVSQSYTFTVGYYQASTRFYINSLRVSDTGSTYIVGTSSTFATPLYNGGTPALTGTTPCLILQQFTVFGLGSSRYVGTSISCFQ